MRNVALYQSGSQPASQPATESGDQMQCTVGWPMRVLVGISTHATCNASPVCVLCIFLFFLFWPALNEFNSKLKSGTELMVGLVLIGNRYAICENVANYECTQNAMV